MKLFNKAVVFTDLHWGLKSNSLQHNMDCMNFIQWMVPLAKQQGCDVCIIPGDWNDNRSSINPQTQEFGITALEYLNTNFAQVFFIPGNHDLYYKDKRDVFSASWAKHLKNVTVVNDWLVSGDVTFAPWLVGDDWRGVDKRSGKYCFGHFELPFFQMNATIEMPDHGELQLEHLRGFETVFSGHFHKRQVKKNVQYIGNAFPHNFSDTNDDARGAMILEWGMDPVFHTWPDQPTFRSYNLSQLVDNADTLLKPNMHVKVTLDVDLSFEEATMLKEDFVPKYNLREMKLIPNRADVTFDATDYSNVNFENVDSVVITQINQLPDGKFDKKLLQTIYTGI